VGIISVCDDELAVVHSLLLNHAHASWPRRVVGLAVCELVLTSRSSDSAMVLATCSYRLIIAAAYSRNTKSHVEQPFKLLPALIPRRGALTKHHQDPT